MLGESATGLRPGPPIWSLVPPKFVVIDRFG